MIPRFFKGGAEFLSYMGHLRRSGWAFPIGGILFLLNVATRSVPERVVDKGKPLRGFIGVGVKMLMFASLRFNW